MTTEPRKVRVRFAPSPTGPLHIGGVRTALFNYLFARQHGGTFVLRIEDTDSTRFVPGAEDYIIETFRWLGLRFDEGVGVGGAYGPYRQSERRAVYRRYVDALLATGNAYIAFDTPEELDAARRATPNFRYDAATRMRMCNALTMSADEVQQRLADGQQYVVRFKVEPGIAVTVHDMIRGDVTVRSDIIDDKVIYKSVDELPTYHLANIVDDRLMQISHVIRGEEWLPSAPLHVLMYQALGWGNTMPAFAHLPLLLKPEGKGKLSKRDGDRLGFPVFPLQWDDPATGERASGYRESGYFPEAVVNFLALLGWNPGTEQEIFSLAELEQAFSLGKCSKAGARFDHKKAIWFNHEYMLRKSTREIARQFAAVVANNGVDETPERIEQVVAMMKDRVNFVAELWDLCSFFFIAPDSYDEATVRKRWKNNSADVMTQLADVLASLDDFSVEAQETAVRAWIERRGYKLGDVMNAFRLALVGIGKGPGMFDIAAFLGKEETLRRIARAVDVLR